MKKSGQVWIETVLYTLIGLALIGLALGFIMPTINAARDRATVEQAINSLSELDARVNEVIETGTGNIRQIEFYMRKGELYIDASGDKIYMELGELSKPYSEPNISISIGRIEVLSREGQKASTVTLSVSYPQTNITYDRKDISRKFTSASTPYKFRIWNNDSLVDISEFSNT